MYVRTHYYYVKNKTIIGLKLKDEAIKRIKNDG